MGLFRKEQKTVEELEQEKIALETDVEEREARAEQQQAISELEQRRQATGTVTQSAGMRFKQQLASARERFMESQRRQAETRASKPQQTQTNPFNNNMNIFGSSPIKQRQGGQPTKQKATIQQEKSFRFGNVLGEDKPMRFGNPLKESNNKRPTGMTIGDVFGNLNKSQSAIFGGAKTKRIKKRRKKRRKK